MLRHVCALPLCYSRLRRLQFRPNQRPRFRANNESVPLSLIYEVRSPGMSFYEIVNLMVSTEASWWNILNLKIYTTLGYIVSLILLNLGHVYIFKLWNCVNTNNVHMMWIWIPRVSILYTVQKLFKISVLRKNIRFYIHDNVARMIPN